MKCKNCNKVLKENVSFCKNCGFDNNLEYEQPKKEEFEHINKINSFEKSTSVIYKNSINCTENDKKDRLTHTKYWKIIGIIILIIAFIIGIYLGATYQVKELTYESSISPEYNDYEERFNTLLMLYVWISGSVSYIFFQAINSICYRLDILIDRK